MPISTFVERVPAQQVGTIRRTDMRRTLSIDADVAPGVLVDDVVRRLKAEVPDLDIDPRVSWSFRGSTEDQQEDMDFLARAMMMALAIMAIILVTQFNSIYQAGLILTAVLFSTGGVLLGHLFMGKPFGVIMSSVGVITLAGIVVNNNIVFIDTYNVLRGRGERPFDAILRTCAIRLRPVLLTTVTTIVGLMPGLRHGPDAVPDAEPAHGPGQRPAAVEAAAGTRRDGPDTCNPLILLSIETFSPNFNPKQCRRASK